MLDFASPLDGIRSPLGPRRGGFNPKNLFSGTSIGIWLDPSDVANLDWRRNQLLWSEQFDNTYWTKTAATIDVNAIAAPDGAMTADKIVETAITSAHAVTPPTFTFVAGTTYTYSAYFKSAERTWVYLQFASTPFGANTRVWFNLSTGVIGTLSNCTAVITPVGIDGWYRCSITATASVSNVSSIPIVTSMSTDNAISSYLGVLGSGLYVWGAQLEVGSAPSDYQRITDLNTEVIALFPAATMFQDRAGTVAVTTPGQFVGVRRDKSGNAKHAVAPTDAARLTYGIEPKSGTRNRLLATDVMATQSLTVTAFAHTLSFTGTGTVTLSGASTAGPLVGTGVADRVSLTFTPTAASLTLTVSGSVTLAQLELGSTATAYQRVTTAFDVTEAGVPSCHYCQFDGSDDNMVTPSIDFTSTDAMSVFAGVWKRTDAAIGTLLELSVTAQTNAGAFFLRAPGSAAANYFYYSGGTSRLQVESSATFPAPRYNLLTGYNDISADQIALRVNGVQVATSSNDQGTGNFGNYPLYIGRRAGASLTFNGRDYGIIVVGKALSAGDLASTEAWLADKTPGVTL